MAPAQRARWEGCAKYRPKPIGRCPSPRTLFQRVLRPPPMMLLPPLAPAEEADELLCDLLLALPDDAWSALAAAVPDELAERLSRYLGEG